jgi:cytochrome c-type biogenesis protein CcmF
MMAQWGVFSLILALLFSCCLVIIPCLGLWRQKQAWMDAASNYVVAQFIFIALSYLCLTVAFLRDDFSLHYVAANSSRALPWFYKICAVWGGHEGSMLLWVAILSAWSLAVSLFSRALPDVFRVRVLVVLGALSTGFILFMLCTSNPFLQQFQAGLSEGRDLNPLLQDPGFLFHPPMLYMGYVGFSVAFSFAIAALWLGRVEVAWAKWTRPWTLAAWCCLTAGITLGSWWAYRELGWGGWWFWDPVENASFMPWLAGTALLHTLAVSEQRQQLMAWTLLLAITGFSLSLVGTFLVRSGVLTSVHAFAVDPARGLYILLFLLVVIGGSLLLFAFRAQHLMRREGAELLSRESALLLNNVFLVVTMLTVLMGTVYPLLVDSLGLGKLSVGAPYFNSVFVPLSLPLLFLMGIGVHLRWQQDSWRRIAIKLRLSAFLSLLLPLLFFFGSDKKLSISGFFGLTLAVWVILSTVYLVFNRLKERGWKSIGQAFLGMVVAHLGVAISVLGIVISTSYGLEDDVKMRPGDVVPFAGFKIHFVEETPLTGPNYHGSRTQFVIVDGQHKKIIYPEKRIYDVGHVVMTDAAIDVNPLRDVYVSLGEPLDRDGWLLRVYYKPLVRWIWTGGFFILIGGLLALSDRRYFVASKAKKSMGAR